jgi:hypothetical protein
MRWLRWAPGTARHLQIAGRVPDGPDMHDYDREHVVPDFTDPATVGVLLAAVREAWASPTLFVRPTASGWTVMRGRGMGKLSDGETEADALVAALEAAATRRGGQP